MIVHYLSDSVPYSICSQSMDGLIYMNSYVLGIYPKKGLLLNAIVFLDNYVACIWLMQQRDIELILIYHDIDIGY